MPSLTPLKDSIIVEQDHLDMIGSVAIPDYAKDFHRPLSGTVKAVSFHVKDVRPGDRVLFQPYSGAKVPRLGPHTIILRLDDILATLDSDASSVPSVG